MFSELKLGRKNWIGFGPWLVIGGDDFVVSEFGLVFYFLLFFGLFNLSGLDFEGGFCDLSMRKGVILEKRNESRVF